MVLYKLNRLNDKVGSLQKIHHHKFHQDTCMSSPQLIFYFQHISGNQRLLLNIWNINNCKLSRLVQGAQSNMFPPSKSMKVDQSDYHNKQDNSKNYHCILNTFYHRVDIVQYLSLQNLFNYSNLEHNYIFYWPHLKLENGLDHKKCNLQNYSHKLNIYYHISHKLRILHLKSLACKHNRKEQYLFYPMRILCKILLSQSKFHKHLNKVYKHQYHHRRDQEDIRRYQQQYLRLYLESIQYTQLVRRSRFHIDKNMLGKWSMSHPIKYHMDKRKSQQWDHC